MKLLLPVVLLMLGFSGCGVETVGSAATGAALKKEELEQAARQQAQFQQKLDAASEQMQQRAAQAADAGR